MPKNIVAYLFLSLLLFIFIRFGLGFDGLYGQDAYEYLRFTKALRLFFETGQNPGDYFWPVNYPLLGALLNSLIPDVILALQAISIISLAITALYIQKTIGLLYPKTNWATLYVALFFMLSPMVFRMGVLVMSDMLSTCLAVLCCYHCLKYYKYENAKSLYFAVVFGVSAIMTRYACFVVLLPFGCYLMYLLFAQKKHLKHLLLLIVIAVVLVLPHFYFKSNNPVAFINHVWLVDWSFVNFFQRTFTTVDGTSQNDLPNIIYAFSNAFHPRYFLFGLPLLICFYFQKSSAKHQWLYLVSFVIYGLFLAGIPFQNNRFLLLSFPLLTILCYPAFDWLVSKIQNPKSRMLLFFLVLALQVSLCLYALKPVLAYNQAEKQIASQLQPYQNKTLYSFDIDIALQGRGLQFDYKSLWAKKYVSFQKKALVLFNPTKFNQQWKGKNPMTNWNNLTSSTHLKTLKKLPDGWFLYEIP